MGGLSEFSTSIKKGGEDTTRQFQDTHKYFYDLLRSQTSVGFLILALPTVCENSEKSLEKTIDLGITNQLSFNARFARKIFERNTNFC